MRVFISWSGDLSQSVAETLRTWLPGTMQMLQPYFTPSDVEKGARWNSEISKELEVAEVGILCITRENLNSPWLLFEAGALSKRLDRARVCPVLFGVSNADLPGPLRQFQTTEFKREEFSKLLYTINTALDDRGLADSVLNEVFAMWWPKLEEEIAKTMEEFGSAPGEPVRGEREILEEILELSRLSARRETVEPSIHPNAVKELVRGYVATHDAAAQNKTCGQILNKLKSMRRAIHHIVSRVDEPSDEERMELSAAVEALNFKWIVPDDDIPF